MIQPMTRQLKASVQGPGSAKWLDAAAIRLTWAGYTIPEIASVTGHRNARISDILDRRYLASDPAVARTAIAQHEKRK